MMMMRMRMHGAVYPSKGTAKAVERVQLTVVTVPPFYMRLTNQIESSSFWGPAESPTQTSARSVRF